MAEPTTHRPGEPPQPLFLALLICDHTIRDGETGKVSLIGIFANIQALDFPVLNPGLSVYVTWTTLKGSISCGLNCCGWRTWKRWGQAR